MILTVEKSNKMKYFFYLLIICANLFIYTSCQKENIDEFVPGEVEPIEPVVEVCDLELFFETDTLGNFTVVVYNGTPPYSYLWSTQDTTASLFIVDGSSITVSVTDANGCTEVTDIEEWESICGDFSINVDLAFPVLNINTINGTPPFHYTWSTGEFTPFIVPDQTGRYFVTVVDDIGCADTTSFEFVGSNSCNLEAEIMIGTNNTLTASVIGGAPPYSYQWSTGAVMDTTSFPESGTYSVTIADSNGCIAIDVIQVSIQTCEELDLDVWVVDNGCLDIESLWIGVSNGSGNYSYLWSSSEMANTITDLEEDVTYRVSVTDLEYGCMDQIAMTYGTAEDCDDFGLIVTESPPGTLQLATCGGVSPLSYVWSGGESSPPYVGLESGMYIITVTDSADCSIALSHTVELP